MLCSGPEGQKLAEPGSSLQYLSAQCIMFGRLLVVPKSRQQLSGPRPSRHLMPASVLGPGAFSVLELAGGGADAAGDTAAIIDADSSDAVRASVMMRLMPVPPNARSAPRYPQ